MMHVPYNTRHEQDQADAGIRQPFISLPTFLFLIPDFLEKKRDFLNFGVNPVSGI